MRRTELDKIDTLEDKIKLELQQLAEKQDQMRSQLDTFTNVRRTCRSTCVLHVVELLAFHGYVTEKLMP